MTTPDPEDPSPRPSLEREFAESTSLHGIARVFHASKLLVKTVWIVIMLTCLCVCVWQISDRFYRFLQYKANTQISVEYVGDLPFPAITICNFNRYRQDALAPGDEAVLRHIWSINDHDYDSYGESDVNNDMFQDDLSSDFNYTEFTLRAGFLLDNKTLLRCQWRGKDNSCSAANFSHVFTSYGNCWTFNSGRTGPILTETNPGSGNGLKMYIDIQQSQYTETKNDEAGLKVLVHDQSTPPMVESSGLALSPGVHAFMAVKRHQYLNLEPPYGKCDSSRKLKRFDSYTFDGCNIECRADVVLEKCHCRLVQHPGNEVECTPKEANGCAKKTIADLMSGDIDPYPCNCPVPCNFTSFTTTLSTAFIPNAKIIPLLASLTSYADDPASWGEEDGNLNVSETVFKVGEYIRKNWISLDIFYEDLNYEKFEQTEAITTSALISDIGGQLGLFMGASFITLAEIFSYLGRKMNIWIHRQHRRPQDECKLSTSVTTST
ncbi:acid-sensing ion channel 1C-like [Patiria miniata]|uniref:Uncharacterized protein n=1 Tax=Patiria miniata TaxID=46514 RepID=A0A914A188_PATMI|nr:acid-sensing ion channel 1C-like [Patiria miniata]